MNIFWGSCEQNTRSKIAMKVLRSTGMEKVIRIINVNYIFLSYFRGKEKTERTNDK